MKNIYNQSILLFALIAFSSKIFANKITVCPSGCGYITIQAAINAASAGDTIAVNINGAITESDISISKNLTIPGTGSVCHHYPG